LDIYHCEDRAQAQEANYRKLSLDKRIHYVHNHLMVRVWYLAQTYPPPEVCARQSNSTIAWFLWRGDIFRVPFSTLRRRKDEGDWGLKHLTAKSHALFLNRLRKQRSRQRTVTTKWLRQWGLTGLSHNPPYRDGIPATISCLQRFAVDSAYVTEIGPTDSTNAYKQRVYDTLHYISRMETGPREMRIITIWPITDWSSVWKILAETPVPGEIMAAWYKVTNDIISTNEWLQIIRIAPTDRCRHCDKKDTLLYRLTDCGEGELIWRWTRYKLSLILRTIPGRIPSEWLRRPHIKLWPPIRGRAVPWSVANVVFLRTHTARTEPARLQWLLEAVQMEDVQEEKPQRVCGELLQWHRRGGVNTTDEQRQDRDRKHGKRHRWCSRINNGDVKSLHWIKVIRRKKNPLGARFSTPVQNGPKAQPASCVMDIRSSPWVRFGRDVTPTPHTF
jgi:hypothetical protein